MQNQRLPSSINAPADTRVTSCQIKSILIWIPPYLYILADNSSVGMSFFSDRDCFIDPITIYTGIINLVMSSNFFRVYEKFSAHLVLWEWCGEILQGHVIAAEFLKFLLMISLFIFISQNLGNSLRYLSVKI